MARLFTLLILFGLAQSVLAHTRFEVSTVTENPARHASYTTAAMITHGCGDDPVIGTVVVFPDQTDSFIEESSDGTTWTPSSAKAEDIIKSGGFIRLIKSNDAFDMQDLISDPRGNPIGFWAGGGSGIPAHNWVGKIPFRISAVTFQENSCAKSLTFVPLIADVCHLSRTDDPEWTHKVNFWSPGLAGQAPDKGGDLPRPDLTPFDQLAHNYNYVSPATFKVTRKLDTNPLPAACGSGIDYRIKPSAAQMNRDAVVRRNGRQLWPLP